MDLDGLVPGLALDCGTQDTISHILHDEHECSGDPKVGILGARET